MPPPTDAEQSELAQLGHDSDNAGVPPRPDVPARPDNEAIPFRPDQAPESKGLGQRTKMLLIRRKKGIIGTIIAISIGGYGFGIISGPLQLISFSNLIGDAHFSKVDDTQGTLAQRMYRRLIHPNNVERRRMGKFGNAIVDAVEKSLSKYGLEPVYDSTGTGDIIGMKQDGKLVEDWKGLKISERSARFNAVLDEAGISKITRISFYRPLMRKRANISFTFFRDLKGKEREVKASLMKKFKDYVKRGAPPEKATAESKGGKDEQKKVADKVAETNDQINGIRSKYTAARAKGLSPSEAAKSVTGEFLSPGKLALSAGAVLLIGCLVKSYADEGGHIIYNTRSKPLMRLAQAYHTAADQEKSGQGLNLVEVGALTSNLSGDKGSWTQSAEFMRDSGKPVGDAPDLALDAWPNQGGFQGLLGSVGGFLKTFLTGSFCKLSSNPFVSVAISAAGFIAKPVVSALSGAAFLVFDRIFPSLVTALAGDSVPADLTNEALANAVGTGDDLNVQEMLRGMGAAKLSGPQGRAADQQAADYAALLHAREPLSKRLFSADDPHSLTAQAATHLPHSWGQLAAAMVRLPATVFGSMASMFAPKAVAAGTSDPHHGIPQYGFDMNNPRFADPTKVFAYVNAHPELKTKYNKCFDADAPDIEGDKDCEPSTDLSYAGFYRAYNVTALGLQCDENNQACGGGTAPTTDFAPVTSSAPPPAPAAGDMAQLAKQVLDIAKTGKITFESDAVKRSLEHAAAGETSPIELSSSCSIVPVDSAPYLNAKLLSLIITLSGRANLRLSALTNGCHVGSHPGDTSISNHYYGTAVDIGNEAVAPQIMQYVFDNRVTLGINELIYGNPPLSKYNLDHGQPHVYSSGTIDEHKNHIHISVTP